MGVLEVLSERLVLLLGDRELVLADVDVLAFLCHRAIGALVIGMSSFSTLWMSFSKPKWAMMRANKLETEKEITELKVKGTFFLKGTRKVLY